MRVPGAEPGSGFIPWDKARVIDWLQEASIRAVVECWLRQAEATMANVEYAITGVNRVEGLNLHVPPVS